MYRAIYCRQHIAIARRRLGKGIATLMFLICSVSNKFVRKPIFSRFSNLKACRGTVLSGEIEFQRAHEIEVSG